MVKVHYMSRRWFESKLKELTEEERKKVKEMCVVSSHRHLKTCPKHRDTTTMNDRVGVAEFEATKKDKVSPSGAKGKWICDVCRNATFDSYTEAVAHEDACRDSKLLASSGKKKQNRCNRELKSLSYSHLI